MKDKRNPHSAVDKSSSEQHFRKSAARLPLSCEFSGAIHLAQPDLTVGWLAGRLTKYRRISKF